jgi:RHS repeat-associated protein
MPTVIRRYFRGHDLVTLQEPQAGQSRVYHFDHQGTTAALTDYSGAVTDTFAADAWGNEVKRTGSSINRQWYVGNLGYYKDPGVLSTYIRARYLVTARGAWLSRDPIPSDSYHYASASPARRYDPSGAYATQVSHYWVAGVAGTAFPHIGWRSASAIDIWMRLVSGNLLMWPYIHSRPLPNKVCICQSAGSFAGYEVGRFRTVNLLEYQVGETSLAEDVSLRYVEERLDPGQTPCKTAMVIWTKRAFDPRVSTWLAESHYPGFSYGDRRRLGPIFWWEDHVRRDPFALENAGGVLAHELGHGVWHLGHVPCGLLHGFIGHPRFRKWSTRCLSQANLIDLALWGDGLQVPSSRWCEPHQSRYSVDCTPAPDNREGVDRPGDVVVPYSIVGPGPCLRPGTLCCPWLGKKESDCPFVR